METARPAAGLDSQDEPDANHHLSLLVWGSDPQDGALVQEGQLGSAWGWAVSLRWVSCFPRRPNLVGVRGSVPRRLLLSSHSPLLRGTEGKTSVILDGSISLPASGDTVHPDR